jgi:hypothetical protein
MILASTIAFSFAVAKIRVDQYENVICLHIYDVNICTKKTVCQICLKIKRRVDFHICMKKTKIVN